MHGKKQPRWRWSFCPVAFNTVTAILCSFGRLRQILRLVQIGKTSLIRSADENRSQFSVADKLLDQALQRKIGAAEAGPHIDDCFNRINRGERLGAMADFWH